MILSPGKRREILAKKSNSESTKVDQEEVKRTYGIDCLDIGKSKHDLGDSE